MNVLVRGIVGRTAKRTRPEWRFTAHRQQGAHVEAYKFLGLHSDEFGQGAVDAQNIVGVIVGHDEIGNRVENLDPVPVRLIHSRK